MPCRGKTVILSEWFVVVDKLGRARNGFCGRVVRFINHPKRQRKSTKCHLKR